MNPEQQSFPKGQPPADDFAKRLAARHEEEQRVRKLYEAGFRKGEKILIEEEGRSEKWEIGETWNDGETEGVNVYRFNPKDKKVQEKKIPFGELANLEKAEKEAA